MIDSSRVLRPLSEAGDATDRLVTYERPAELAEALEATWSAVERSLRLLLRSHTAVAESERLGAFSPEEMPLPRLVEALRKHNLVSMELAGRVHELAQAAQRAASGDVRASDADVARQAVMDLRRDVMTAADSPIQEVAHRAVETGAVEEPVQAVRSPRRRPPLILGLIGLILLAVAGTLVYFFFRGGSEDAAGMAAFQEQRLGVAEEKFRQSLDRKPDDLLALLYLGRIYRRQGRLASADSMLGMAMHYAPEDPDVRRERGHLLMAAGQPSKAAIEYDAAIRADPSEKLNWLALVQALRAANDPRVEDVIQRAPADVQAALRSSVVAPAPGPLPANPR